MIAMMCRMTHGLKGNKASRRYYFRLVTMHVKIDIQWIEKGQLQRTLLLIMTSPDMDPRAKAHLAQHICQPLHANYPQSADSHV
jgi:hypothetical protein